MSNLNIDVSKFPVWKESVTSMVEELDHVYNSAPDNLKASKFITILSKYDCLP